MSTSPQPGAQDQVVTYLTALADPHWKTRWQAAQALGDRHDCLVHTVPGGELARKLIREHKPSRIIAVACERDLVSGIQDVAPVIPTFAVPNCRPEGPCKNTVVDIKRIEEALILFSPVQKKQS